MGQGKKKAGKVYRTKKLSTPKSKADKKRDRSHGGFLVAMGTFVAACAWTLWGSIQKERENMQRSKVRCMWVWPAAAWRGFPRIGQPPKGALGN